MITTATAEVWQCTECGWVWFKREGKIPKRCPNANCRKLAQSINTPAQAKAAVRPAQEAKPKPRHRMSVDAFESLPYSEQMRVRREGKAPY